jgi:hypothetical protein
VIEKMNKKHSCLERAANGQKVRQTDEDAVNRDILDYVIIDWKNIKHPITGEDVPCTTGIKVKLPGEVKNHILDACGAGTMPGGEPKNPKAPVSGQS